MSPPGLSSPFLPPANAWIPNYYKTHGSFECELSIDDLNDAIGQ